VRGNTGILTAQNRVSGATPGIWGDKELEVYSMNRIEVLFPLLIMVESVAAGLIYVWRGQWAHAGYWVSAAVLTLFVTLMKG